MTDEATCGACVHVIRVAPSGFTPNGLHCPMGDGPRAGKCRSRMTTEDLAASWRQY